MELLLKVFKYRKEHFWALAVCLIINFVILDSIFSQKKSIQAPLVQVVLKNDETVFLNAEITKYTAGKKGLGNLPGLQMRYRDSDIMGVAGYFKMMPFILNSDRIPVYRIDFEGNTLVRVQNENLGAYSPRARKVKSDFFEKYLSAAKERLDSGSKILTVVFLVPKEVEERFVSSEHKILSANGLSPEKVIQIKGSYVNKNGRGYDIALEKALLKSGEEVDLNG